MSLDKADDAVAHLMRSYNEADTLKRQNELRSAQVFATLALHDKVGELTGLLRAIARAQWRDSHFDEEGRG